MKVLEMIFATLNEKKNRYISMKELIKNFKKLKEANELLSLDLLHEDLNTLVNAGLLKEVGESRYQKLYDNKLLLGKFYYSPKGKGSGIIGTCNSNKELKQHFYVDKKDMNNVLHEDYILFKKTKDNEKRLSNARIIQVIKRNETSIIGTVLLSNSNETIFISDNNKYPIEFYIHQEISKKSEIYDRVIAKVIPDINNRVTVKITDVLGFKLERESVLKRIIEQHDLKDEFPLKVLQLAERLENGVTAEEIARRSDYRGETIFTIDSEDAKDLDDAVSIDKLDNGNYLLGVYIADVAHYVKENGKIDKEAFERGTSVYLVDTVLPMLPEKLSNGLCSLTPHTDKLTLNALMEIDTQGNVVNSLFEESVIRSVTRLHYGDVTRYLNNEYPEYEKKEGVAVTTSLRYMHELTLILMEKRNKRGTIDFDFPEAKIILDGDTVVDVKPYERGIGNQLIEEFMIVCNETVSEFFHNQNIPFVYRIHEKPSEDRIQGLSDFLEKIGYKLPEAENIEPKHLQAILNDVSGKEDEKALQLLILQVMKQARYSEMPKGHFGLATDFYSHFTSPIRRYPDLMIHRILKSYVNKSLTSGEIDYLSETLKERTKLCSKKERIAERAENELRQDYKLEFMLPKIGEQYTATITSMSNGGFSIILPNTVEGFVPLSTISNKAKYNEEMHRIDIEDSFLLLGQSIEVELIKVKPDSKEIVFKFLKNI